MPTQSQEPLLKLTGVEKRYPGPNGTASLPILNGISLEVRRGDSLAIVGPSGSGKSTLLQIIGTLDQPSGGEVWLGSQNLAQLDERSLAAVRNRQIGFVFQSHYLLPQCTVLENVLVPTLVKLGGASVHGSQEPAGERAQQLLTRVGLGDRMNHLPGQLSGGERQRVAVVRALINRPLLLLADEPTGALDQASAEQLGNLLTQLNQQDGITLIVVTHSADLARRMGKVMELKGGKLVRC